MEKKSVKSVLGAWENAILARWPSASIEGDMMEGESGHLHVSLDMERMQIQCGMLDAMALLKAATRLSFTKDHDNSSDSFLILTYGQGMDVASSVTLSAHFAVHPDGCVLTSIDADCYYYVDSDKRPISGSALLSAIKDCYAKSMRLIAECQVTTAQSGS
jgi:hypothetical protein